MKEDNRIDNPKHIVLYLAGIGNGGTEHVAVNVAEGLYAKGYKVTVVITAIHGDELPLNKGIDLIVTEPDDKEFNKGRLGNFRERCRTLRNIWLEERPDAIISFIGKNNMMALLTTWGMEIPVYVAVRGEPTKEYYNAGLRLISKTLFAKAEGIIVQTYRMMEYFPHYLRKKCIILPNSVGKEFVNNKNVSRTPDNTIVTVGRCNENKKHKMLIDAFIPLKDKYPDLSVYIYGEGESRGGLLEYVKERGISDRVFLPGEVTDTKNLIKNAGIFVLTSDTEGMPNALIEAMALGLPVISTDCPCGGPAELIKDGVNGLLVPVRDTEALSAALDKLLGDENLRRSLGKQAALIADELEYNKVIDRWISVVG